MKFKKFKSCFSHLGEKFICPLEAWLGFVFALLILTLLFYTWPSEQSIRISGYLLQLLGMLLAIRGVLKIRDYFNQPKLMYMAGSLLKKILKRQNEGYFESPSIHVDPKIQTGNLAGWSNDNPEESLDKRFEAVIKNLEILKNNQKNIDHQVYELIEENIKFKNEVKRITESIKEYFNNKIEETHTNGILVSLIGLFLLTFGITLSTLSSEFYELIK